MSFTLVPSHKVLFPILLALVTGSYAQSSPTSPQSPSATNSNSFPTITDTEGTGQLNGNVGSSASGNKQGATGTSSSFSLSGGAIAGIAIASGLVVISIVVIWFLWFFAKREEMTFRQTLTHVSRRMTGRPVPPTPRMIRKMSLPDVAQGPPASRRNRAARDVEKGNEDASIRSASANRGNGKYDAFMGKK